MMEVKGQVVERLLVRQSRALFALARLLVGDQKAALSKPDGIAFLLEALGCYTLLIAEDLSSENAPTEGDANGDNR